MKANEAPEKIYLVNDDLNREWYKTKQVGFDTTEYTRTDAFIKRALREEPEYSYFETIYHCGKKPRWNVGDILAYYEFYSDREGEHVLGKVTNVELNEEQEDWFYTLEDDSQYYEASLLENETYKKN